MSDSDQEEIQKKAERDEAVRQKMEAFGFDPDNAAQFAKFQDAQARELAGRITTTEARREMDKLVREQTDKDFRDAAKDRPVEPQHTQPSEPAVGRPIEGQEPSTPPEKSQSDWRQALVAPGYQREFEGQDREIKEPEPERPPGAPHQDRPIGDPVEKKPEEKEVDWRRSLTDPDYRREIRAQERAEQLERTTEQRQEQGPQRPSQGRER